VREFRGVSVCLPTARFDLIDVAMMHSVRAPRDDLRMPQEGSQRYASNDSADFLAGVNLEAANGEVLLSSSAESTHGSGPGDALNGKRCKGPRLKLDSVAYRELCREVLERDRWRCQWCGKMQNLQVHHIWWRSHHGDDSAQNLLALCISCHQQAHRQQ
jgi:hypothetical protein